MLAIWGLGLCHGWAGIVGVTPVALAVVGALVGAWRIRSTEHPVDRRGAPVAAEEGAVGLIRWSDPTVDLQPATTKGGDLD